MRFYPFFGILSVLAFMAVVWLTVLYQLDDAGVFTQLLLVGGVLWTVWSVIHYYVWYG